MKRARAHNRNSELVEISKSDVKYPFVIRVLSNQINDEINFAASSSP